MVVFMDRRLPGTVAMWQISILGITCSHVHVCPLIIVISKICLTLLVFKIIHSIWHYGQISDGLTFQTV